jgi:hypothetical protein
MAPAAFEGTKTNKAGKGSYKLESGVDTTGVRKIEKA